MRERQPERLGRYRAYQRRRIVLQESGGLITSPMSIDREFWVGYKIYVWFLLVTLVWAAYRMLRIWYRVPPFFVRLQQCKDPGYLKLLEHSISSFARCSGLVFLGWGLVTATATYRMSIDLQRGGAISAADFLSPVGDLSASLCAALWVVLFLYLARWHLLNRIERYHPQDYNSRGRA
jgi:hypothetical protein